MPELISAELREAIEDTADKAWDGWEPGEPLASFTDAGVFRAGFMAAVEFILQSFTWRDDEDARIEHILREQDGTPDA
jgi:hypothetical protein